jgi:hypothetical protein
MPSYFCSRCHAMVQADYQANPDIFLCPLCRQEKTAPPGIGAKPEERDQDRRTFEICGISEWK